MLIFYLTDLEDDYIINVYQSIYVYLKLSHIFKLFHSFPLYVGVVLSHFSWVRLFATL